jgi:hypothetical protein
MPRQRRTRYRTEVAARSRGVRNRIKELRDLVILTRSRNASRETIQLLKRAYEDAEREGRRRHVPIPGDTDEDSSDQEVPPTQQPRSPQGQPPPSPGQNVSDMDVDISVSIVSYFMELAHIQQIKIVILLIAAGQPRPR